MFRQFLFLVLLLVPLTARAAHQVKFINEIAVEKPLHLAVDNDGSFFVTTREAEVAVFSPDGRLLRKIRAKDPEDDPALKKPTGIALYEDRLFVCDRSRDRIVILSKSGDYLDSFGEGGSGVRQFSNPEGIFVYQGVVYVADSGNDRIQVFSDTGVYLQTIGRSGEGERLLRNPTDVAVDNMGRVYAIDGDSRQVKIFRQNGSYLGKIAVGSKPFSLAMTADGLFVTDMENYNVTKFNFAGEKLFAFGTLGTGRVQFKEIGGIGADSGGRVYAIDVDRKSVQIIETDKPVAADLPLMVAPPTSVRWLGEVRQHAGKLAWDKTNRLLYAIDTDKKAIAVIRTGQVFKTIKVKDLEPASVSVDPQGALWVFDRDESQLVKMDRDGNVLLKVGASGSREGYFSKPRDIFAGRDKLVYVADTRNDRIQVFNAEGVFLNAFTRGSANQPLESPISIDQDAGGNLYVLLDSRNTVAVLSSNGEPLREFGGKEDVPGRLEEPVSLVVAGSEVLVLDAGSNRVKVFSLSGEFQREFGSKGKEKGSFRKAASLALGDGWGLFVADAGNDRIQEFNTVYTPESPREIRAKAGMRSVRISWRAPDQSTVDTYRLFRSKGGSHEYQPLAEVSGTSYRDNDLLPDVQYSYRVTARVKGGNENPSLDSSTATPLKYKPGAPLSLEATSQEWSVDLTWKPTAEPYLDHYNVYRDSDEEGQPPTLLGTTKETSYSEGGLESDTQYTYLVSAVSIDGVESDPAEVDISTIVAVKPPLEIEIVEMNDIFSNTYKIYENEGIGRVRLTNNTRNEILGLKLAFAIKEYMDFPTEVEIKSLPPKQGKELVLKAVFNNRILEVTEDTPVQTELKASYYENQKLKSFSRNHTVNLYEKHRMIWTNKDRVATFVTSKDPVVLEFTRSAVTQYADIGSPLVYAAAVYDYLGLIGMTYLQHPNNPYQIVEGKTSFVDYVQYPRETLKRNSGVCTDLVVFFAAALEGLGIRTMLLGTPDHIFIMFAVGQVAELGDSTMNGMFAIHDDTVWAPVELTLVGSTFMKAWETGSKEYYEWKEKGIEITDLGKAWGRFKPATLPVTEWRAQPVKRSDIDSRFGNEMVKLNKLKIKYTSNRYFARINSNPADGNAYQQLGIIYGEAGELDDAGKYLEKARSLLPGSAEVANNLGNVYYLKKDYQSARLAYEKAAELDPADPYILVNLSLCHQKLGNKAKAAEIFQAASRKDPTILQKHRAIAIELLGSM